MRRALFNADALRERAAALVASAVEKVADAGVPTQLSLTLHAH